MVKKLKGDCNVAELLKDAQKCKGEVCITTKDGDKLNLKSTLSQYVLIVLAGNSEILQIGELNFDDEDEERLSFYTVD